MLVTNPLFFQLHLFNLNWRSCERVRFKSREGMKTSPPGNGGESTFSRSLGKWDVDPTPWLEVSSYRPFKNLIMIRFPKWNLDHSHSRVKTCLNQVLAHMNDLTLLQETLKGTLQMKDVRHGPPKFFWSFFWSRVYVCMKVRANYNSFQMLTHRVPPLNHNTPTLWEMELTVWCNNPSYISFCQMGGVEGVSQVWKKKLYEPLWVAHCEPVELCFS